jgi:hypothetical protein
MKRRLSERPLKILYVFVLIKATVPPIHNFRRSEPNQKAFPREHPIRVHQPLKKPLPVSLIVF